MVIFPYQTKLVKFIFAKRASWVSTIEVAAFPAWSWVSDMVSFHRQLVSSTWFFYSLGQEEMRGKNPRQNEQKDIHEFVSESRK